MLLPIITALFSKSQSFHKWIILVIVTKLFITWISSFSFLYFLQKNFEKFKLSSLKRENFFFFLMKLSVFLHFLIVFQLF